MPLRFFIVQAMTTIRVPFAIIIAILLLVFERTPTTSIISLIILCMSELSDMLDGLLARHLKVVSTWGAMLDPYSDSISRLIIYWTLAVAHLAIPLLPLAMAVRDVTVAYCRIILMKSGQPVSARWSGKIKAWAQGLGSIFLLLGPFYWKYTGTWTIYAISWIVLIVTLGSIVEYAIGAYAAEKNSGSRLQR